MFLDDEVEVLEEVVVVGWSLVEAGLARTRGTIRMPATTRIIKIIQKSGS